MKGLVVQLGFHNIPPLDDSIRHTLLEQEEVNVLPPDRAKQAWGDIVPSQVKFNVRILNSAVFITDDWTMTFEGTTTLIVSKACASF